MQGFAATRNCVFRSGRPHFFGLQRFEHADVARVVCTFSGCSDPKTLISLGTSALFRWILRTQHAAGSREFRIQNSVQNSEFRGFSRIFKDFSEYFQKISEAFQDFNPEFRGFSKIFQGIFKDFKRILRGFSRIPRKFRGNSNEIPKKFRGNSDEIPKKFRGNSEEIHRIPGLDATRRDFCELDQRAWGGMPARLSALPAGRACGRDRNAAT